VAISPPERRDDGGHHSHRRNGAVQEEIGEIPQTPRENNFTGKPAVELRISGVGEKEPVVPEGKNRPENEGHKPDEAYGDAPGENGAKAVPNGCLCFATAPAPQCHRQCGSHKQDGIRAGEHEQTAA